MSEWIITTVGKLGKVVTGKTPSKNNPEDWGNEYLFITPSDYGNYNKSANHSIRGLSEEGYKRHKVRMIPKHSCLVTCIGSDMGKVVMNAEDAFCNQQINALIPNTSIIDSDYAYYFFKDSALILKTLGSDGTAVPILNKSDFEKIELSIPPLPEQKAIASVLSSLDDKIDLLHRQNKTLEAMAKTLFRQWFIEEAKEDWEEKTLEHVISHFIDYRGKTPNKTTSGIPLITAKIVKDGRIQAPTEFISEEDYPLWMTRGYPEINDVVLTTEAPLGEIGLIRDTKVALAQRIITLRCDPEQFDNVLLKYYLMSEVGQYELDSRASGTTVFGIKASVLKKLSLAIPPLEEQREIAQRLHTIEDKMYANEQQARILAQLRDTLLPKLMSGEVRVQVKQESAA